MIKSIFEKYDILITGYQEEQLQKFYELLVEWNKKINLTAITEHKEVIYRHFIDSALIFKSSLFDGRESADFLDIGTGAGFPGIVLAILRPQYTFTLVDSLKKRIEFLHIIKKELNLNNISLFHGRAEEFGRDSSFRNHFEFVVSRAVAELPVLLEYCIPFVKRGGYFVAYKGRKYMEEIEKSQNAFIELDSNVKIIEKFLLLEEQRFLLFIENHSETNIKYPRKAGKVKKKPL